MDFNEQKQHRLDFLKCAGVGSLSLLASACSTSTIPGVAPSNAEGGAGWRAGSGANVRRPMLGDFAVTSATKVGNCIRLVGPSGAWILQARYERNAVSYETPRKRIVTVDPASLGKPGLISIRGVEPFTLLTTAQGITAVASSGLTAALAASAVSVTYPNGEHYAKPLVGRLSGATPDISGACARDVAGMGLAMIGLIAGCALTGGALALFIVAAAGYLGLGISEWAAIKHCY